VRRTPQTALLAAIACAVGLATTGVFALLVPLAHARDSASLQGFTRLNQGGVTRVAATIAHLCDPLPYALFGLGLAAVALARRRRQVALAVLVILGGAAITTELLKPLLATPRVAEWLGAGQIGAAAWPSGHATAAMALGLCGVLVAPARVRPLAGLLGGALAVAVSYSILVLAWHFPSDVLGGFLVAGLWTSLAAAVLWRTGETRAESVARLPLSELVVRPPGVAVVLVVSGALAAAAVVAALGPGHLVGYAGGHRSLVAGAAAIAALALALAGGLARTLSRAER